MPVGMYDLPLMNKVMDKIEADQDSHRQSVYAAVDIDMRLIHPNREIWGVPPVCKTAFCYAGHALYETGHDFRYYVAADGDNLEATITTDGQSIHFAAQNVLGLSDLEADIMFAGHNSRALLRYLVDSANAGRSIYAAYLRWMELRRDAGNPRPLAVGG